MVIDPLKYVEAVSGEPYGEYKIVPPSLDDVERRLIDVMVDVFSGRRSLHDADLSFLGGSERDFVVLLRDFLKGVRPRPLHGREELNRMIEDLSESLSVIGIKEPFVAVSSVFHGFGLGDLEFPLYDGEVEEIEVNGSRSTFVYHRKLGYLEAKLSFDLSSVVRRLRRISSSPSTILDVKLPDGERANVVLPPLSEGGPSITIRRFSRRFYNLLSLVRQGTLTPELLAYLWLLLEGMGVLPHNLIVAGNTGGGKTTTLNALLDLVPFSERIITIEDTRELSLVHPNVVHLVAEDGSLDSLLRTALRMRPDRIVVGEVRGPEAETLLAAMNVGHSGYGTLHANSARDVIRKLTTPPMGVPSPMLGVLNLVLVQHRMRVPGRGVIRRVVSVAEVVPAEGGVSLSEVFRWDPKTDTIKRTAVPSSLLDRMTESLGLSKKDLLSELKNRERVVHFALSQKMDRPRFLSLINTYYHHPEKVLKVVE